MINRMVIFGATGDLTSRYLGPALARLQDAGRLPDRFRIRGVARDDLDTGRFRAHLAAALERQAPDLPLDGRDTLVSHIDYRPADVTDRRQVARALEGLTEPAVLYLTLPPALARPTIEALTEVGVPPGSRLVVEKPFGEDLTSAQDLNRLLHRSFPAEAIFRMDHFLGLQTTQNVLGLRFGNRIFEPLWSRDHIARVAVTWDETVALEGRAGYYDRAEALRDMIQNHLLQLVCLVGMEPPVTLNERDLRDRKVDVLRAVRRLSADEVERLSLRARYGAGRVGERDLPAYVDEPGVDPGRSTETFAQVTLFIDNWRWADVPFVLRTGKAMARFRREIAVHFRPVPHLAFEATPPPPNVLRFQLDPDRMALAVNINGPGNPFSLEPTELDARFPPQELSAYGHLLLDVLEGNSTLSIRGDEAEESWRIVEPILDVWAAGRVPLREYPAGSEGPPQARQAPSGDGEVGR